MELPHEKERLAQGILAGKRVLSMKDEAEYRGKDAASRWLEKNEKKRRRINERGSQVSGVAQ